jgi:signal peptidase II
LKRKYLILFSLSGLILACDQLIKSYVHAHYALGEPHPLIPGLLSFIYKRNSGFAFGMLQKAPPSLQEVFFIGVPVFALILIVLIFIKLRDNQMLTSIALTTILAGATGNLIDRMQYGFVVDFLVLHWRDSFQLPAFNIADCSIIIGVTLMFINTMKQERALSDAR